MAQYRITFPAQDGDPEHDTVVECDQWNIGNGGVLWLQGFDGIKKGATQIIAPECWRNAVIEPLGD